MGPVRRGGDYQLKANRPAMHCEIAAFFADEGQALPVFETPDADHAGWGSAVTG